MGLCRATLRRLWWGRRQLVPRCRLAADTTETGPASSDIACMAMDLPAGAAPRCSVILPTYNRLRTLPRAVASVLAQDEPDFELIIVDDASTDGTQRWLATLADPRIRLITCDT